MINKNRKSFNNEFMEVLPYTEVQEWLPSFPFHITEGRQQCIIQERMGDFTSGYGHTYYVRIRKYMEHSCLVL